MAEADDEIAWVAQTLQGDTAAFEAIVRRYQRVLFSVALRLLGNSEDAMDATQNAFISAYEHLDTFDPSRRFFSWIYRIAVNESLNLKRARRPVQSLDGVDQADANTGDPLHRLEQSELIDAALVRLPEEQRLVVVLRHFADMTYTEIGEAMDLPEKTVKSRLFEARQRLGTFLRLQPGA